MSVVKCLAESSLRNKCSVWLLVEGIESTVWKARGEDFASVAEGDRSHLGGSWSRERGNWHSVGFSFSPLYVCVCVHTHVCVCVWVCLSMRAHVEVRGQCPGSTAITFHLSSSAEPWAPVFEPDLPSSPWDPPILVSPALALQKNSLAPGPLCERWDLNEGPCLYAISPLPIEPHPNRF